MPKEILRAFPAILLFVVYIGISGAYSQNQQANPCYGSENQYKFTEVDSYRNYLAKVAAANATLLDKKYRQQYSKIIDEKNDELVKQLNDNGFLFDDQLYPYLQAILNHILEKNNLDKSNYHFFVDRTSDVNAYSFEDGTIVCDLGLLSILQNESQVAMVFCHELGHALLNHVNISITRQLEKVNSPAFLARVRQIKRQEYNTKKQLEDLMMSNVFDKTRHSRSQEKAADSLGMILFSHTAYNGRNISLVFDILDSSAFKSRVCTIKDFFKKEKFNTDDDWFKPAKKMSFGGAITAETSDSLKTHPDCAQRKVVMRAYFDAHPKYGADFITVTAEKFEKIRQIALFDEAAYARQHKDMGYYLYLLIQDDARYPSDNCVKTEIFDTLVDLCKHQKAHDINTIVRSPYITSNDYDEYPKLLQVLDRLNLKALSAITITYYNNNKSLINASAEAINNLNK
ncbi:MAG TPA: M48 family metalloprotease [Mucilaginibacter sp.]|jgi:hypothetical protein|nr:M48 family metalloprotease [Mucilaginibacter sp.]